MRTMNLEEQVRAYFDLGNKIEELEKQRKILREAILEQVQDQKIQVTDLNVYRYKRLSIQISIEEARVLNAVKWEETVDKEKIKELYRSGQPVSGVSEIQYLRIAKSKVMNVDDEES